MQNRRIWANLQEFSDTFYIFVDKEPFAAAGVNSSSCHCSGNVSFEMQKSSGPGENLQPLLFLAVTVAFILSFTFKWPQKVERWDPNQVNLSPRLIWTVILKPSHLPRKLTPKIIWTYSQADLITSKKYINISTIVYFGSSWQLESDNDQVAGMSQGLQKTQHLRGAII